MICRFYSLRFVMLIGVLMTFCVFSLNAQQRPKRQPKKIASDTSSIRNEPKESKELNDRPLEESIVQRDTIKKPDPPKPGAAFGVVSLPIIKRNQRVFRGSAYRSRISTADASCCGSKSDENNTMSDVIIGFYPLTFKAEPEPMVGRMNQKNATFIPHVLPVTPGSTVEFVNDDNFYHNVFSKTPGNSFNIGRRATGEVVSKTIVRQKITGVGEIKIFCDIHAQMGAVILSLDTPYFTRSMKDGRFEMSGLPQGKYEVRTYHPDYSEVKTTISIESGKRTEVSLRIEN